MIDFAAEFDAVTAAPPRDVVVDLVGVVPDVNDSAARGCVVTARATHGWEAGHDELRNRGLCSIHIETQFGKTIQDAETSEADARFVYQVRRDNSGGTKYCVLRAGNVDDVTSGNRSRNFGIFIGQRIAAEDAPVRPCVVVEPSGVVFVVLCQDAIRIFVKIRPQIGCERQHVHRGERLRVDPAGRNPVVRELQAGAIRQTIRIEDPTGRPTEVASVLERGRY